MKKTSKVKKSTKSTFDRDIDKLVSIVNPKESYAEMLKIISNKTFPDSRVLAQRTQALFTTEENMDELNRLTAEVYKKTYTPEEVKAMVKFYSTKCGSSVLNKMPQLAFNLANVTRVWSLDIVDRSKNDIEKMIKEEIEYREKDSKLDATLDPSLVDEKTSNVNELAAKQDEMARARYAFSLKYIEEKKWDRRDLSEEQIQEIQRQDGWINARG